MIKNELTWIASRCDNGSASEHHRVTGGDRSSDCNPRFEEKKEEIHEERERHLVAFC